MSPLFKWRPNAEDAAKRSLLLFLIYQRGDIEDKSEERTESEETRKRMLAWTRDVGLWDATTEVDRYFLQVPVGSLDRQARVDAFWRRESLGTLLWALGAYPSMLQYDEQFGDLPVLPVPGEKSAVREFLKGSHLRPSAEIDKARDVAELWNWRSRTTRLISGELPLPEGYTPERLRDIVEAAAKAAHERGDIPRPIQGDFPVRGEPYAALGQDEFSVAQSIAMERHYALNWLCGNSKDWDRVPTET
jgi:Domain of unknown function (DUF4272)